MNIKIRKQDHEKSKWDKSADARENNKRVIAEARTMTDAPDTRPTTRKQDGIFETPDLKAARIAEEQRRKALKNPAPVKPASAPLEVGDTIAIIEAFFARTGFHKTPWNVEQLSRCIDYNVAVGNLIFSSSGLNACYKFLNGGGYLETAVRHRGQSAPKEFPEYVPQPAPEDINAKRPLMHPAVRQVVSKDEYTRLQNMPLEDLAAEVRKNYNHQKAGLTI
jgi:hypothetical protein